MKRLALILVVALLMVASVRGQTGSATADPIQIQVTVNGVPAPGPTITVFPTDTISVTCQIGYSAWMSGAPVNWALAQSALTSPWDQWPVPGGEQDLKDDGTTASIDNLVTLYSTGTMQYIPGMGGEEYPPGEYHVHVNSNVYAEYSTSTKGPWSQADWDYAAYDLTVVLVDELPEDKISDLIDTVVDLNLQEGIENSLDAKLAAALNALDDLNENNDVAAINSMQAFINAVEAQSGNKIATADADALIADAQAIIDLLLGG